MKDRVDWSKIKIPTFGMSDAMVRYKNGTLPGSASEILFEKYEASKAKTRGKKRR